MSEEEGTGGLPEVQQIEDVEQDVEQEVTEPGGSPRAGSPRSQQLPSMQDSTPGDWEHLDTPASEQAFAESPSLERSSERAPAELSALAEVEPAGPRSISPVSSERADAFPWQEAEEVVYALCHPPPVQNDSPHHAGDSPERVMARHHTIFAREVDVDRIEEAPSSTPRPEPDVRSPCRPGKRAWEGLSSEQPSAKCLVRRLGALMPLPRLAEPQPGKDRLETAAQALRQLLHAWKRLLGLTACAKLQEVTDRLSVKPSISRRLCPALGMILFLLVGLGGVGLQWARCQKVYLSRLSPDSSRDNGTSLEYVCQHSFVWTYLLPRLIFIMGYISVFVCWFCLKQPDFITVVAEVYDAVTDQHEYPAVSDRFVRYCRRDRHLLAALFVLVALLSAVGTLVGDGVISGRSTARDSRQAGIVLAADVFNFVVALVFDNVMFFGLVSHTLSLKYFDLILLKTQTHLGNITGQAHISSDCYVKPQYQRGHRLMVQSQACISAVLLMVLLRVCQAVTLMALDQSLEQPRAESLGLLPLVLAYTAIVLYHIYCCYRLTVDGRTHHLRHVSTGPNFATGGTPDTDEATDEETAPLEPRAGPSAAGPLPAPARTTAEWGSALEACPAISGRVFGLEAGPWMYGVLALVVFCYCAGYYAVERFWPLF